MTIMYHLFDKGQDIKSVLGMDDTEKMLYIDFMKYKVAKTKEGMKN